MITKPFLQIALHLTPDRACRVENSVLELGGRGFEGLKVRASFRVKPEPVLLGYESAPGSFFLAYLS